jgi:hypothetical protein
MHRASFTAALVAALALAAPAAQAFVFRIGDTVYADGKQYSWEEWKKIRETPNRNANVAPTKESEQVAAVKQPQPAITAGQPRAGSCSTRGYFDEFPADDERFDCSAGLGLQTREALLQQGWKIDLVEKIPASGDAKSSRGLPLFRYKLVISR